jgi:hypothetical protein
MAQDANAAGSSLGSMVNRSVFKSAAQYRNNDWDLVDALDGGGVKLTDIKQTDLPENMRAMTPAEQEAYVNGKRAERQRLSAEIAKLNEDRQVHLGQKLKEMAGAAADTLDSAMAKAIQAMLAKKDFKNE